MEMNTKTSCSSVSMARFSTYLKGTVIKNILEIQMVISFDSKIYSNTLVQWFVNRSTG